MHRQKLLNILNENYEIAGRDYNEMVADEILTANTAEDELLANYAEPIEKFADHEQYKEYQQWKSEWDGDEPAPQEHMTFEDWLQEDK